MKQTHQARTVQKENKAQLNRVQASVYSVWFFY